MTNPLVCKLERFTRLSTDERRALDSLSERKVRRVRSREHIIHEGDKPGCLNLIVEGWACRYKLLADGRRQIVSFFLPGDLCDLHVYILSQMDHSIVALTPLAYVQISRDEFEMITNGHPRIICALWWDTLVAAAIQREWTVNVGQRSALERAAHLLLELYYRLESVGLADDAGCYLPLKQTEIADALGMTPVHTNRVLQALRAERLIVLKGKRLVIPDLAALERVAMFNPNYLHLQREGRHLDAND